MGCKSIKLSNFSKRFRKLHKEVFEIQKEVPQCAISINGRYYWWGKFTVNVYQAIQNGLSRSEILYLARLKSARYRNLKGGEYLGPNGKGERKGKKVVESKVLPIVYDKKIRKNLWELSEKLIGETFVI